MRPFITATFCFLSLPFSARADFIPVLPGPIDRVVAAGEHVAVIRKGTVFILHEDGSLLGRMAGPEPRDGRAGTRSDKKEGEHLLDLLDIAEIDRDTDFADELLYDEQRLAQRRPPGSAARLPELPAPPPALGASASMIWIAGTLGIFHVGADGRPVRKSGPAGLGAPLAAAGESLLASRGSNLALLGTPAGSSRFIQLSSPAHKVALSEGGRRLAWVTSSGVWWSIDSASPRNLAQANAVADLSFCADALVVLTADSVLVFPPDGRPEIRAKGIQARRLLCPEEPAMPWLALGPKLLASTDQGRHWEAIAIPAGMAPVDVATSAHHLWLATPDGLYASVDGVAPSPTKRPDRRRARMGQRSRSQPSSRPSWWLSWMPMPKLSVRAAATFAPGSHQLEALAFAAFPLGGSSVPVLSAALPEGLEAQPDESPERPRRAARVVDLHDPDESCLTMARRKAVELVLSEPERARSYVTRAGHAAWLPELRVLVSRRYGRSESIDVSSSSTALTSPLGIDTVNDIRYEARATWDLGKLVFSSEELAAQNQAMHMAELRRDIETTMNRLYFERRGLVLDMSDGHGDNVRHHLRATEVEAELDAMSGGAFATCVSGK
jgi:hypothetical protein